MKYFKCGKCKEPYQFDETKIPGITAKTACSKCGAVNAMNFGPQLVIQSKGILTQFSLKMGINNLGRNSPNSISDIGINDEYVSKKHASIILENINDKLSISIIDNNSTNGTFTKMKLKLKSGLKYPFLDDEYFIIGLTKLTLKIK